MSGWVSPRTWVTGDALNATNLNTIRDSLIEVGDYGTAFTPSWTASTTNPTLGNGSLAASYRQTGQWVDVEILVTFGTTTTAGSGTYFFTLPGITSIATWPGIMGTGFVQNGFAFYGRTVIAPTATAVALVDTASTRVTNASPVALASGMRVYAGFRYQTT